MAEEENKPEVNNSEEISYTTNESSSSEENEVSVPDEQVVDKETLDNDLKEEFVKPKKGIFLKILFGIIAVLILLLVIGTILYFTGFFKHEEIKKEENLSQTSTQIEEPSKQVEAPSENNYKFEIKDINSKKLNEQLANLTNKNITEQKIEHKENIPLNNQEIDLNKQKEQLENEKIAMEKEKARIELAKVQAKDSAESKEIIESNANLETKTDTIVVKDSSPIAQQEITKKIDTQFLLVINVAKIKGNLYKKYLDKIVKVDPNVKLCRDEKNRIEIYFGPFKKNEDRSDILDKLLKNKFTEAYPVEFTKEEFDKRCNY